MSQKQVKKYARTIKRNKNKIIKEFVFVIAKEKSLYARIKIAIKIILGKVDIK